MFFIEQFSIGQTFTPLLLIESKNLIKPVVLECILELGIYTYEASQLGSRWLAVFGANDNFLASISRGDTLSVASFISTGSDVNKTDVGFPLLKALSSNQPHIIEFLVKEAGSFIHEVENGQQGNSLLHKAPQLEASVECVEVLIKQGADVNAMNRNNQTALFTSLAYDRFDITEVLFRHNPRVDLIDANGNSVLDLAIDRMATAVVAQILSAKSLTYKVLENAMIKANPITTSTTKMIGSKMLSAEYQPKERWNYTVADAALHEDPREAVSLVRAFLATDPTHTDWRDPTRDLKCVQKNISFLRFTGKQFFWETFFLTN